MCHIASAASFNLLPRHEKRTLPGAASRLHRFACPHARLAKALDPCFHGFRNRDLACLSPSIAPHPQIEFVNATAVPAV
jgi:hypothetical protein